MNETWWNPESRIHFWSILISKKGEIVVICVFICAFICVCVCVLMKLGMNCVMLCQVGAGVATCNLEYKMMNGNRYWKNIQLLLW